MLMYWTKILYRNTQKLY